MQGLSRLLALALAATLLLAPQRFSRERPVTQLPRTSVAWLIHSP